MGRPWPTLWPNGDKSLKLRLALLLACVNNMPHESVKPTTLLRPFYGVSLKFSAQTLGRLESEKPECRIKVTRIKH